MRAEYWCFLMRVFCLSVYTICRLPPKKSALCLMMSCWDNVLKAFHCRTLVRRLFSFRSRCQHSILPLNSRPKKKTHGCGFTVAWTWTPSLWDFTQINWMRCCFVNVTAAAGPLPKLQQQSNLSSLSERIQVWTVMKRPSFYPCWKPLQGAGCRGCLWLRPYPHLLGSTSVVQSFCCSAPICASGHIKPHNLAALSVHVTAAAVWAFPYLDDNCKCISKQNGKNLPPPRLACINVYSKSWNLTEGRL